MKYGDISLSYEKGSLAITKKKTQLVRHYIGTDISDNFPLGKNPTSIKCNIVVETNEDRILAEQLFHENTERNLTLDNILYKRVITSDAFDAKQVNNKKWIITVEFVALDPIPYDTTSGEVLY